MSQRDVVLSGVVQVRRRIRDVDHSLAVVPLQLPTGYGYAIAVVESNTGEVLAWDNYDDSFMPPTDPKSLLSNDWEEWDDMPSKLALFEANGQWMGSFGLWLMPHYSVARAAAELVEDHSESPSDADNSQRLRSAPIVAYVPVVDRDVFDRELSQR